ncbi:hypothetical protein EJ110_NYTH45203, partial [Nymphaea thermarum]
MLDSRLGRAQALVLGVGLSLGRSHGLRLGSSLTPYQAGPGWLDAQSRCMRSIGVFRGDLAVRVFPRRHLRIRTAALGSVPSLFMFSVLLPRDPRRRLGFRTVALGSESVPSSFSVSSAALSVFFFATGDAVLPAVVDVHGTGSNLKGENVPVHVTSIRLNKDNYLSWSAALEIGITSRGRLQYITGEKPAPAKNDPQWATWTLEDSQGESSVASFYAALKTKWEELDYHTNDDWKNASDQALYWKKEWTDRTFIFLGGLRDEFESVRSQLLNCDEIPGIEEVYARVEAEEQRRQIMHIDTSHGSFPTAF